MTLPRTILVPVDESEAALAKLAEERRSKAQIADTLLRTGDSRDIIIQAAEEVAADVIVMGTRRTRRQAHRDRI